VAFKGRWLVEQVYGDGQQTRSFQYVTDLVDGLVALMNSNFSLPVNIGNPDEHTVAEFATIIKKLVGQFYGFVYWLLWMLLKLRYPALLQFLWSWITNFPDSLTKDIDGKGWVRHANSVTTFKNTDIWVSCYVRILIYTCKM